jgi:polyadenylate-binding protein
MSAMMPAVPQQQPITQQTPQQQTGGAATGATAAPAAGGANPAPQTTGGYQSASLFVGDLHPDVTESFLFDIFKNVGSVASIRVCRDHMNRQSLGYAYVNYHNVGDAERALEIHNFHVMKGKPCRIMWSQRDPALRKSGVGNIFVKNLDPKIDNKSLFDTFSLFGNILSCKVATDAKSASKGYGYVHYETLDAAKEAIEKINGMSIVGQIAQVGMFTRKSERVNQTKWTNIYVKNLPESWDSAKLQEFFTKYGEVTSAMIQTKSEGEENTSKGFGFVNFAEHESAKKACDDTEPMVVKDGEEEKTLVVCRAQKKAERDRELASKYAAMKKERLNKYQGVNVYVKNLDDEIDDEFLNTEFAAYGTITSAKVMRDEQSGVSKGFGFVCFGKPEEAQAAITDKNNKVIKGKPIYVALAQRKEVRKAQIHAQRSNRGPMGAQGMGQMPPYNNNPYMYQQRGMMYPQPMMPRGAPRNMYMRGGHNQPGGYMPYNMQQGGPMQGQQQQGGRGNRRNQRTGRGAGNMQQGGRNNQFQYTSNARNQGNPHQQQRHPQEMQQQPPQQMPQQVPPQQKQQQVAVNVEQPTPGMFPEPLTLTKLTSASAEQQKNMLGERLYPLIQGRQPDLAGKITGMLLEMENAELLNLLESPPALDSKIQEALEVLRQHQSQQ